MPTPVDCSASRASRRGGLMLRGIVPKSQVLAHDGPVIADADDAIMHFSHDRPPCSGDTVAPIHGDRKTRYAITSPRTRAKGA